MRIDIGSGKFPKPGYIGIDIENYGQSIVRDITRGLPFSNSIISNINLSHCLEHIPAGNDMLFFISEIYRVCRHNALIDIRVPHSDTLKAADPVHLSYWNEEGFRNYFDTERTFAAIPVQYRWKFKIALMEKHGLELHVKLSCDKSDSVINTENHGMVSIIIVAHNQFEMTKRCIESIHHWTRGFYEIILVDSGSDYSENEYKWLEENTQKTIRFTKNAGWIDGINSALGFPDVDDYSGTAAICPDSKYIIFANNDILITEEGWLERLLSHFNERVGAVGPTTNYVMGRQHIRYNHDGIEEEPANFLIGFFMCIRKNVIDLVGRLDGYEKGGADDLDYSKRIRDAGYDLIIARDVYVHHIGSQTFLEDGNVEKYNKTWKAADKWFIQKWGEQEYQKLFQHPINIALCIPMRNDYVHRLFASSLKMMVTPFNFTLIDAPRGIIDDSRNNLVKHAMDIIGADYVMFLDDDHYLPSKLFLRLYNMRCDVASALAFKRNPPHYPCIYQWAFDKENGTIAAVSTPGWIKRGVHQVDATGFAAVLIKKGVFEKIPYPWFKKDKLGEDLDFCWKCRDYGIDIYCDTDLIVQHIGNNTLINDQNFYEEMKKGVAENDIVYEVHGGQICA